MLPGPPTIYQTILNHPDFDIEQARLAAPRGHGRRERPGGARSGGCATTSGSRRCSPAYGLTEASGIATMCPPRRRPRDHRQLLGPGHPRESRCASSTTPGMRCHVVNRARSLVRGYNVMKGYFDDAGTDRRDHRRRRLAPHRRRRRHGRRRLPQDHRPHEGHVHRRRLQRLPRRDRVAARGASRHRPGAVVGVPDERMGEVGYAFVVLRPGATVTDPTRSSPWAREHMANFKAPATCRDRRRAAAERLGQGAASSSSATVLLAALAERGST